MSATVKPETQQDIVVVLGLGKITTISSAFTFANLTIHAHRVDRFADRIEFIETYARHRSRLPMLVFCLTKKQCDVIATHLVNQGLRATAFHSGLEMSARKSALDKFLMDEVDILMSTYEFTYTRKRDRCKLLIL